MKFKTLSTLATSLGFSLALLIALEYFHLIGGKPIPRPTLYFCFIADILMLVIVQFVSREAKKKGIS